MQYRKRKIPVLLISNRKLVKTTRFRRPNYLGDPINAVRIFSDKNADEILICDIDNSKLNRPVDLGYLHEITEEAMVPLAYIGGIRRMSEIEALVTMGYEKIGIDSFIWQDNGALVNSAVKLFGASTMIAGCTVRKIVGRYIAVGASGPLAMLQGQALTKRINYLESLGVGEIFLNYVNGDGTFAGIPESLIMEIPKNCRCNIVVCGGAASFEEAEQLLEYERVSAVAAGSIFVYDGPGKGIMIDYPKRQ